MRLILSLMIVPLFGATALAQSPAPVAAPATAAAPAVTGDSQRAAYLAGADKQFDRLDANHDGVITREEVDAAAAEIARKMQTRMAGQFARADADHDGKETRAEFQAVAGRRYDRLDRTPEGKERIQRALTGSSRQP